MNTKKFSEAMGELDIKYVEKSMNYQAKKNKKGWLKLGAMAASLAVAIAAFSVLSQFLNQQSIAPPDTSDNIIANNPNIDENTSQTTSEIHISMSGIFINQVESFASADYARYNLETDVETIWDKDDIISYYGTDLAPEYIPNGLLASEENAHATVYTSQDGKVVEDTVCLNYYHEYYEDGSPKLTENIAATKGFTISVSKIGIADDCYYLLPENEIKLSDIEGIAITFGYRSMPYGPYHSETHEPSGYYDMYVAEFEKDGVEFKIVAHQVEIEELVKVVSSIICGERVIIDK